MSVLVSLAALNVASLLVVLLINRTQTCAQTAPKPEMSGGEGIPPVSDASFTKETHTRSLTQLPILGNMRQWTKASRANSEVLSSG